MIFCSTCGAELAPDAAFCSKCGTATAANTGSRPNAAVEVAATYCYNCGHKIPHDRTTCQQCGASRPEMMVGMLVAFVRDVPLGVGLAGAVLVLIGAFAPIASVPDISNRGLFSYEFLPGLLMVGVALLGGVFATLRRFDIVGALGALVAALLYFGYVRIRSTLEYIGFIEENPTGNDLNLDSEWGVGFILLGGVLFVVAGIIARTHKR